MRSSLTQDAGSAWALGIHGLGWAKCHHPGQAPCRRSGWSLLAASGLYAASRPSSRRHPLPPTLQHGPEVPPSGGAKEQTPPVPGDAALAISPELLGTPSHGNLLFTETPPTVNSNVFHQLFFLTLLVSSSWALMKML